jgi:predicted GIY-YIG superfamily endonuclease
MSFYCYLLCTHSGGNTYVGATTEPDRRLDQHNGKRSGGARATGIQVAKGEQWRRVCLITGIPEWRSALQIEWRWKQLSRKETGGKPLHRRLRALRVLLSLEKPTQTAIPYDAYPDGPPTIQWDSDEDAACYASME